METKRKFYIFSFTFLGALIGFTVQAIVEYVYIRFLIADFVTYGFGLSWNDLVQFMYVYGITMIVACGLWGWAAGRYWWKQIYVFKHYPHGRWIKF